MSKFIGGIIMINEKKVIGVNDEESFQQITALVKQSDEKILNEVVELKKALLKSKEKEKAEIKKGVMLNLQIRLFAVCLLVMTLEIALLVVYEPPIFMYMVVGLLLAATFTLWLRFATALKDHSPDELNEMYEFEKRTEDAIKFIVEFCGFYALILKLFT